MQLQLIYVCILNTKEKFSVLSSYVRSDGNAHPNILLIL